MAGDISNQTTNLSNLSVSGLVAADRLSSTGTISGAQVSGSDLSSTNTVRGSTFVLGGGTALTWAAKGSVSVVTMTCTANGSTTTTATVAGVVAASDIVMVNPPSSMSSGVNLTAFASGASTITLIFSNCSTAAQVVAGPLTVKYLVVRS